MKYQNAKKRTKATAWVVRKYKPNGKNFRKFYLLWEHRRREHGAQRGAGAQNVDNTQLMGDVDDNSLKEKPETCKKFSVDSEMENERHRV